MFNPDEIARAAVAGVQSHLNHVLWSLYFMPPDLDVVAPLVDSPLRQQILLLCEVANGNSQHEGEVAETIQAVHELFIGIPMPATVNELLQHAQLWLHRDELITLSEAAQILRGSSEDRDLIAVGGYIERGRLTAYTDPREANRQRARRVSRAEVEALRASSAGT